MLKFELKGFSNGFLPSILEMPQCSDMVMMGIFPLLDSHSSPPIGSCRALGPAFRRGTAVRGSFDA